MNREQILESLNEISDKSIEKALTPPKRTRRIIFHMGAVAAVLAVAIFVGMFSAPMNIHANAVALAPESRALPYPQPEKYSSTAAYNEAVNAWHADTNRRESAVNAAQAGLMPFFSQGSALFLANSGEENSAWSPVNAFIALAMLAELTDGESRSQILSLFNTEELELLRRQSSAVWESVYRDSGDKKCILANSLWMQQGLNYKQEAMDSLAHNYYASIYQGDLSSPQTGKDIATWVNQHTGDFLKEYTKDIQLDSDTILALFSTLYLEGQWVTSFNPRASTQETFHSPVGDKTATFMNSKDQHMVYLWGEQYSAVSMPLRNNCQMWIVLPDEGVSPAQLLEDGSYLQAVTSPEWENRKAVQVNLSLPKFDLQSKATLIDGLKEMGVTDVFLPSRADFSAITADTRLFVSKIDHAVRVQIDEEGIKAAAYTEIDMPSSGMPPTEQIDFVADRPFLFVITGSKLPLFVGCVNNP